jgi:hypothetical protein
MRPQALEEVLRGLPRCTDSNVLVGTDTSDDAGVYKLTDEIALVQVILFKNNQFYFFESHAFFSRFFFFFFFVLTLFS